MGGLGMGNLRLPYWPYYRNGCGISTWSRMPSNILLWLVRKGFSPFLGGSWILWGQKALLLLLLLLKQLLLRMNETILRAFKKGNPPKGKGSHWNYCLYLEASSSSFPSFLFDKSSVRTQILKHWLGWVMVPHIICFLLSPSFSKWEKVLIS